MLLNARACMLAVASHDLCLLCVHNLFGSRTTGECVETYVPIGTICLGHTNGHETDFGTWHLFRPSLFNPFRPLSYLRSVCHPFR